MLALTATQDANGARNQDGVLWMVQILRQHHGAYAPRLRVWPEGSQLLADFVDYMGKFSSNMLDILEEEIRTPRPTPGSEPDPGWAAIRFAIGIPLTCDRHLL